jgi:hypothetical protein
MLETIAPSPVPHRLDATEIVTSLVSKPEYEHNVHEGYATSRALARSALELAGMNHNTAIEDAYEPNLTHPTPEIAQNALIGTLPAFVHGIEGIRHFHTNGQLSSKEYRSMKGRAARFNHSIKAMIEQDTSLNFRNITDTVATLYGVMNRERWGDDHNGYKGEIRWFNRQFDARLRGMQQEVLGHQIIEAINQVDPVIDPETGKKYPRVEVNTNVSVEDDLGGADMYVTLEGVTFPIDIKASERTAEQTRTKSLHPKSIITTGITCDELRGAFRVNSKRARKAAPAMLQKLYAAREEYLNSQTISADNTPANRELALAA